MKAGWGIALAALGGVVTASMPATARPALTHDTVIAHGSGALHTVWTGAPRVTSRQIGSPGTGGKPQSLRCLWRVDLDIVRHARSANGISLQASARAERAFELSRPGWCGRESAAFAGQFAARDRALQSALHEHAAIDTRAVLAQADASAQGARPTG